jgi:hypothetical protein
MDDMDRVVPLDQLDDFDVSSDDPDPRGWDVVCADGKKIGEVDELLVDTQAMRVRYLDVDLDDGVVDGTRDRHVLIPIGSARLERGSDCVHLEGVSVPQLGRLPEYNHAPLTRDFETRVRASFEDAATHPRAADAGGDRKDDFYAGPLFDESRFYGRRRADHDAAAG